VIQDRLRCRRTTTEKNKGEDYWKFHGPFHYMTRSTTILDMSDAPDFETALKKLEEIVKKLENGDLSLDSALELFEEGIKLSRFCHTRLEEAERRVEILLKNNSGQPKAVPFESENER
jgi:exodeoxyribonuclease VII small subunit